MPDYRDETDMIRLRPDPDDIGNAGGRTSRKLAADVR